MCRSATFKTITKKNLSLSIPSPLSLFLFATLISSRFSDFTCVRLRLKENNGRLYKRQSNWLLCVRNENLQPLWIALEWQWHRDTKLRKRTAQPCGIQVVWTVCYFWMCECVCVFLYECANDYDCACVTCSVPLQQQQSRMNEGPRTWRRRDVRYAPLNRINNWRRRTNILKIVTNDSLLETANCLLRAILVCHSKQRRKIDLDIYVYITCFPYLYVWIVRNAKQTIMWKIQEMNTESIILMRIW